MIGRQRSQSYALRQTRPKNIDTVRELRAWLHTDVGGPFESTHLISDMLQITIFDQLGER